MQIVQLFLVVLFFICCIVLVFLIMIQSGKGGSLGIFGGAGSSTPFGTSTVDIVTKVTWYGAAAFFGLAILAAVAFADLGPRAPLPAGKGTGTELPGKTGPDAPTGEKGAAGEKTAPGAGNPPAGKGLPAAGQ